MPTSACSVSLILPAYNEARTIAPVLRSVREYFESRGEVFELIVVADGDDGTRELAASATPGDGVVKVIGSAERLGKGHAIRRGAELATGAVIGYADADDKTPIEEYELVAPWLRQGYDVVIGTRHAQGSKIEHAQRWYRQVGSVGFRAAVHALGLSDLSDTQCGFKFFRGEVARDLFARQVIDGYMFDVEILYLAVRAGYRVREVGVRWRDDGDSRLDLVAGYWRNLRDVLGIRLRSYPPPAPPAAAPGPGGRP